MFAFLKFQARCHSFLRVLALGALLGTATLERPTLAETVPSRAATDLAVDPYRQPGIVPRVISNVPLELKMGKDGEKTHQLPVFRAETATGEVIPGEELYCVAPIFAIVENQAPFGNFGPLVHEVSHRKGVSYLRFKFQLTSDLADEVALSLIELSSVEQSHLRSKGQADNTDGPANPNVLKHPLSSVLMICRDGVSQQMLSSVEVNFSGQHGEVEIDFPFEPAAVTEFCELQQQGKVQFVPVYRFRGQKVDWGTLTTTVNAEIVQKAMADVLSEQQRGGNEPILQAHVNAVDRKLVGGISRQMKVTNPSLLQVVDLYSNDMVDRVFDSGQWVAIEEFRTKFSGYTDQMLANYLMPHIETQSISKGKNRIKAFRIEAENARVKTKGGGANFVLASSNSQTTDLAKQIKAIESTSGVGFQEEKSGTHFRPHRIRLFNVAVGSDTKELSDVSFVQIGGDLYERYQQSATVDQYFTREAVEKALSTEFSRANRWRMLQDENERQLDHIHELKEQLEESDEKLEKANKRLKRYQEPTITEEALPFKDGKIHLFGRWPLQYGDADIGGGMCEVRCTTELRVGGRHLWLAIDFECEAVGGGKKRTRFGETYEWQIHRNRRWKKPKPSGDVRYLCIYSARPGKRIRYVKIHGKTFYNYRREAYGEKLIDGSSHVVTLAEDSVWKSLMIQAGGKGDDRHQIGLTGQIELKIGLYDAYHRIK